MYSKPRRYRRADSTTRERFAAPGVLRKLSGHIKVSRRKLITDKAYAQLGCGNVFVTDFSLGKYSMTGPSRRFSLHLFGYHSDYPARRKTKVVMLEAVAT